MLDTNLFITRLKSILNQNDLSSAAFADLIKVQRSSISHLLNGRNKPSLEFIMKINETFKEVDLQWLLYGKGNYPCENLEHKKQVVKQAENKSNINPNNDKTIERIVIFYSDGTFKNYNEQ